MTTITSGTGNGYLPLKVDENNRAHTSAVTIPEEVSANKDGDAFNIIGFGTKLDGN